MSTQGYKDFLRNMGHHVYEAAGVSWFNVLPYVYTSFPFQTLVSYQAVRNAQLLEWKSCLALRYPCSLDEGKSSYRLIISDPSYGMSSLTSKARNQTRRSLEQCHCRAVTFDELLLSGIELNLETLSRQGRKPSKDFFSYWQRYYHFAAQAEGAEAWGCFVAGKLAAYLISFYMEGTSHILIMRSHGDYLKYYPNNALLFTYLQHSFQKKVTEVSIGFESLQTELGSLDHFKSGMGFKMFPVGQRIEIIKPLNLLAPLAKVSSKWLPKNELSAKFTGMINCHLEQPRL